MELLREAFPNAHRVGFLWDSASQEQVVAANYRRASRMAPPEFGSDPLRWSSESALEAALRIAPKLSGVLPIQGPPGSGKTFIGARIICELAHRGARIGITANSHKVIRTRDWLMPNPPSGPAAPELSTAYRVGLGGRGCRV